MKVICLEGINGCGKTTLQKKLKEFFEQDGKTVLTVRDPGTSPLAEAIRPFARQIDGYKTSPITSLLAFCCARSDLVDQVLRPSKADIVVLDRWWLSTYIYQCTMMGNSLTLFWKIFKEVNFSPDITVLVDDDPEVALRRAKGDSAFEEIAFQRRLREAYLKVVAWYTNPDIISNNRFSEEFHVLRPELSLEERFTSIIKILVEKKYV